MRTKYVPITILVLFFIIVVGCSEDEAIFDSTSPEIEIFVINDDDDITNSRDVTITLLASDNEGTSGMEYRCSNNVDFSDVTWMSYETSFAHELTSGDGLKIVYGQVKDAMDNLSAVVADSIQLITPDTENPIIVTFVINDGDASTDENEVTVTIIASDNSGLMGMEMRLSENQSFTGVDWQAYQNSISFNLSSGDGEKTVYGQVRDASDNMSQIASDNILLDTEDTTPPVITQFLIDGGNATTETRNVMLSILASDDGGTSGMTMRIGNDSGFTGSSWIDYQENIAYELPEGDGTKTVYAQVRDLSLNNSDVVSDNITLITPNTIVFCNPDTLSVTLGETGTIRIEIENAYNMISAKFVLQFDPAILNVEDVVVDHGVDHILGSTGANVIVSNCEWDNQTGTIVIGALAQQDNFVGVSGDGLFATIELEAITSFGQSAFLEFISYEVYNYPVSNPPIPADNVTVVDGVITYGD